MKLIISLLIGMVLATIIVLVVAFLFFVLVLTWTAIKQICGFYDAYE